MSILSEDLAEKTFQITVKDLINDNWTPHRTHTYVSFIKCIHLNNIIKGHVVIYEEAHDEWRLDCYDYDHSTRDKYTSCIVTSMENLIGCVNQFENFINKKFFG